MNHRKPTSVPVVVVAIAITLVAGILHGNVSGRFGQSDQIIDAAEKLTKLPAQIGDWRLDADRELSQTAIDMLRCAGYCNQTYVNQKTGEKVGVAVMLGPSGPMSVHAPEVCYAASFELIKTKTVVEAESDEEPKNALWDVLFESKEANRTRLNVLYGWSTGEGWIAPKQPRFKFAGTPFLYKLQISHPLPPGESDSSVGLEFFQALIPHLETRLINHQG